MKNPSPVLIGIFTVGAFAATTWNHQRANGQEWQNPNGNGNVKAEISDKKINWGTTPPWTALDKIKEHCLDTSCGPGKPLVVDTEISEGDDKIKSKIQMTVSGVFGDKGEWGDIDQLVELAKTTLAYAPYDVEKAYQLVGDECIGLTGGGAPTACTSKSLFNLLSRGR